MLGNIVCQVADETLPSVVVQSNGQDFLPKEGSVSRKNLCIYLCIVDSNKEASLPGHGTNISLQKQVTAMGKCMPVANKDNEEGSSGINIQNHTEKVVQQMAIPSSPKRIKKTEERKRQHMKTLEDECQHKQQKKELVGKVKTVDPIGESVVAIQYLAFNESQMPEEIIPQESNSHISGLKVDESAVSPTCKIKQLTITHVADSNEGKAFCDQEKKDKVVPKGKSEQVQHENIMPPSPSNTNRRDAE